MIGQLRVARFFGIDLLVHWSWFLVFGLLTYSLGDDNGLFGEMFPEWSNGTRYTIAGVSAFLFFASVVVHEYSHSLVALRYKIPVRSITVFIFGGVSNLEREASTASQEFWIAFAGPAMSFVLAALFGAAWFIFGGQSAYAGGVLGYLAWVNFATGVFNLIPGYPLDGGRVLRAILWGLKRNMLAATKIASRTGTIVAYLMMAGGVVLFFTTGSIISGFWFIFIGFFLKNASESSYEQLLLQQTLRGVRVSSLMAPQFERVGPETTLQELVEGQLLRTRFVAVMVETNLLGIVTVSDIKEVPQDEWATRTAYRTMTPRERLHVVQPDTPIAEALQLMATHDIHQIPVIATYDLLGFVTRSSIVRYIQFRSSLQPAEAAQVTSSS
ncbi:MAG: site-2 protease family protein [Dehalococcoidia bacterium]